jgi:broad specificity phosphatase PhoE
MIQIHFVRHSESLNNALLSNMKVGIEHFEKHATARSADPGLTELGKKQSICLIQAFAHLKNVEVLCSPMKRTIETILPTTKNLNLTRKTFVIHRDLYEVLFCVVFLFF